MVKGVNGKHILVTVSESTELLLTGSVPAVEPDLPVIREEVQRMNFHADCGCT
jgi:hypothetical protein